MQLARQLSTTTGKKQYGYLKPELKRLVDIIVTEFSKDPRIAELYNLWYDQKESGIRFYQDGMPERIPLTDNPEFRTVKNMILQEAENLAFADLPIQMTQEKHGAEKAKTGDYNHGKNAANHNANHNRYQIASTVARLFASLVQLLYEDSDRHKISKNNKRPNRILTQRFGCSVFCSGQYSSEAGSNRKS